MPGSEQCSASALGPGRMWNHCIPKQYHRWCGLHRARVAQRVHSLIAQLCVTIAPGIVWANFNNLGQILKFRSNFKNLGQILKFRSNFKNLDQIPTFFSLGGSAPQTPRNSRPPASLIHVGFPIQID